MAVEEFMQFEKQKQRDRSQSHRIHLMMKVTLYPWLRGEGKVLMGLREILRLRNQM